MAPAKATAIMVAELVSIPRSRNTTMVRATASFAPLETPMTKGPAMEFAKGLQKVSRCAEGRPQQRRHDRAGQAQLQDDVPRKRIAALAQQRRQHRTRCKGIRCPRTGSAQKHRHGAARAI